MALRAKKPVLIQPRFKALIYANTGVGKTHFCCSFPNTYYIDTERLEEYEHLTQMIIDNNGEIIFLKELSEIIAEVKELLSTKHDYKTLVIDSLSFPYNLLCNLEAERLAAKSSNSEGTEFGANMSKAKRLIMHLGILLTRLDMNVIVTSHEKSKFSDGKEIGKTYDINDKMGYSLGTILHLRQFGEAKKAFIEKSRYPYLKIGQLIDFNDGYQTIKSLFGENALFVESKNENLATPDQVKECKDLVKLLNIPEEIPQKWFIAAGAHSFDEMSTEIIQKCIDSLRLKIKGEAA